MDKMAWPKRFLAALDRYKYALLVAALGTALLLWPGRGETGGTEEDASGAASAVSAAPEELETAMEEALGQIDGVGEATVLLTLETGGELVLAQDSALRYSGSVQAPDDYERTSDVVTNAGSGGVVVTQEKYPAYRGALVVCDGGGSDAVRLKVVEAVSALTGLGTDKIAVTTRARGTKS